MTTLSAVAANVLAGQWAQLPAPAGLSQALFDYGSGDTRGYFDKAARDPVNRQVRFIGKAHYGDQRYHQYDEDSHTFSNLPDPPWDDGGDGPTSYLGHGYQHNTIDPATGDHYYWQTRVDYIHKLDRATGVWSTITGWNTLKQQVSGGLEWLPSIGTQGGLILYVGRAVHRWDKATNVWTEVARSPIFDGLKYHSVAVRLHGHEVVAFGGGYTQRMFVIGESGGVVEIPECPVPVGIYASVTTACPETGDLLAFRPGNALAVWNGVSWSVVTHTGPNFGADVKRIWACPLPEYGVVMVVLRDLSIWLYRHG